MPRRRSVLWVPGDQSRKVERAASTPADVVVLDLEDGVAADRKEAARDIVSGVLASVDFGATERVVRLNGGSELEAELETARAADAVFVPKVRGPRDLAEVRTVGERVLGRVPPMFVLWAETAAGLLHAHQFVTEAGDVVAWMWGSEDLASAVGARARRAREGFDGALALARTTTVVLAAATQRQAIDTVYPFFEDLEGLRQEAKQACALGFTGKGIIHPAQIEPVHDAFRPSDEEVARALAVLGAFADGQGVVRLDGQMLDLPHLAAARSTLSRADYVDVIAEEATCS